ncbi:MAG: sugar phosphate isomerase/epimerase family protein [Lachnospiraceae bacterium]|jgi:D-psicose/D-tagatose/L-ribulose 3-epimerase
MGKLKFGICTGVENIGLLQELGYDYIEMGVAKTAQMSEEEFDKVCGEVKNARIGVETFNSLFPGTFRLSDPKTPDDEIVSYLDPALQRVKKLGGKLVVFGSGKSRVVAPGQDYSAAYRRLVEVYRLAADTAAKYGLEVVIEPLTRGETNIINSVHEGALLRADVNRPNLGLLADFYHMEEDGDHVEDIADVAPLRHIHIASLKGRRYPMPEDPDDYLSLFKMLAKTGYEGRVSIEARTDDIAGDAKKSLVLLKSMEKEAFH